MLTRRDAQVLQLEWLVEHLVRTPAPLDATFHARQAVFWERLAGDVQDGDAGDAYAARMRAGAARARGRARAIERELDLLELDLEVTGGDA